MILKEITNMLLTFSVNYGIFESLTTMLLSPTGGRQQV